MSDPAGDPVNDSGGDAREAEVEELEADIARTRRSLGENVEALAFRLNPDRIKEAFHSQTEKALTGAQEAIVDSVHDVTDRVTERTRAAGQGFFDMVSRHPLPTALIGAGIVLLAAGGGVGLRRSGDDDEYVGYGGSYSYGEGDGGTYSGGTYGGGDYSGYVRPAFGGEPSAASGYTEPDYGTRSRSPGSAQYGAQYSAYDSAGGYDAAYDAETPNYPAGSGYTAGYGGSSAYGSSYAGDDSRLRDRAAGGAKRAGRGLTGFIESQPLVAGLVTAAIGALIGIALPGTRREDELMGGARDNLASQAREAAGRAREVAQKSFDEAKETAKQEFGKLGEEVRAGGERVVQEGQEAAKKVADTAKETAKETAKSEPNKKS